MSTRELHPNPVKRTDTTYELCSVCGHYIYEGQLYDSPPNTGNTDLPVFHVTEDGCRQAVLRGEPRNPWGPMRNRI